MPGSGPQAAESLKQAQQELERLFLASSGTVQSWHLARRTWDDEVAQSTELQMFDPLVRDARSLHSELGQLANVLMGI
jgi:hypothetical protein